MKKATRLAVFLLTAVFALSVTGVVFCLARHTHHACNGADCTVCAVLEQCEQHLHSAARAAAAIILLSLFTPCAFSLTNAAVREISGQTPVSLKVKLLD